MTWAVAATRPAQFAVAASWKSLRWAPGSVGALPVPAELLRPLWIARSVGDVLPLVADTLLKC